MGLVLAGLEISSEVETEQKGCLVLLLRGEVSGVLVASGESGESSMDEMGMLQKLGSDCVEGILWL